MKRILIVILLIQGICFSGSSQTLFLNHGQYGGLGVMENNALSLLSQQGGAGFMLRQQWVGLEGAPRSLVGTGHIGLTGFGATTGIAVRQDGVGVERHTEVLGFFAKSIRLTASDCLGMSINIGMVHYVARYSSLDVSDQSFREDVVERDGLLGVSLVLYRPERYYVGVSLPRMTRGGVGTFGPNRYEFPNQYFLTCGALFGLDSYFHLRPSVRAVYNRTLGLQLSGSAMVFADRKVGLGMGMRTEGELSGLLRFHFGGIGLGYSYQLSPGNRPMNRRINNSTHEIGLSYEFSGQQRML